MAIELTKISSKGQVVIPQSVREKMALHAGEVLAVSSRSNLLVLKRVADPIEEEDIETLKEIEEAWKEISAGKFKRMKSQEFLREISKW
jgi:AbrB family looped-hinge helix DNA binding protein